MKKLPFKFKMEVQGESSAPATVSIRGIIGDYMDDYWNMTNTEEAVLNELNKIPAGKKIRAYINTLGGRVDYALGIYNAFRSRGKDVTTVNAGFACSSGSLLMLAGDTRICPDSSLVMIHQPMGGGEGNVDDLSKIITGLKSCTDMMADIYAKALGITPEKALEMMKAETWMTGKQAVECGFATASGDGATLDPDSGMADDDGADLEARGRIVASFKNVPVGMRGRLLNFSAVVNQPPTNNNQPKNKMKSIIAVLVAAGITVPADADENGIVAVLNPVLAENKRLKAENEGHVTARKTRVTALIDLAVTDKIIAEGRKAGMLSQGIGSAEGETEVTAQINDLRVMKAAAAPVGRGARPLKADANDEAGERTLEIVRAEMEEPGITPARRSELALEARKLRGAEKLFAEPAAAK